MKTPASNDFDVAKIIEYLGTMLGAIFAMASIIKRLITRHYDLKNKQAILQNKAELAQIVKEAVELRLEKLSDTLTEISRTGKDSNKVIKKVQNDTSILIPREMSRHKQEILKGTAH